MIIKVTDHLMESIINKFVIENDYYVLDEIPGWLRAQGYDVKMLADDDHWYLEFANGQECSKFLLEWM
jgi:hypothetical protein